MMKKQNFHYFEIKGLNQERFFNNLSKKYQIFEIDRVEKNRTRFKCKYFDGKKIKKEVLDAGFEIIDEKQGGFFCQLAKMCTCYGVIIALALCSLMYLVQLPFIQRVEVWGECDSAQIKEFVCKNLPSKNKNIINLKELELLISAQFEDLSFVSAAIVGQSLVINAKKAVLPPEMEQTFSPLVSQYDGVVTKINLIQGTAAVSVGDIIQKGQTLVEGWVTNSQGQTLFLPPRAEIYMDVWLQGEQTHFDKQVVTSRTGKKVERVSVSLFGKEFYSNNQQNPFSQFEEETTSKTLTKNNILPFVITKTTYYQTSSTVIESTFEEKREQTIASARAKCLQNLDESAIIKEENYLIVEGAGFTTVRYVVTLNLCVTGEDESLFQQTKADQNTDIAKGA